MDPTATPAGTERTVAFKTQTLSLFGRVDRLDDRAGTLVVVDYKTSRRAPTEQDARTSLPLALYAAAVWKMFRRRCVRVELHHVPSGAVAAYEHSDESLVRKVREAESLARDLRAVDRRHTTEGADADCFAPRLSPLCLWCDYRAQCREGQLAGPEKSSWAALEESTDEPGIDADRTGPDGPEWDGSAEPVEDAPLGSDSAG